MESKIPWLPEGLVCDLLWATPSAWSCLAANVLGFVSGYSQAKQEGFAFPISGKTQTRSFLPPVGVRLALHASLEEPGLPPTPPVQAKVCSCDSSRFFPQHKESPRMCSVTIDFLSVPFNSVYMPVGAAKDKRETTQLIYCCVANYRKSSS